MARVDATGREGGPAGPEGRGRAAAGGGLGSGPLRRSGCRRSTAPSPGPAAGPLLPCPPPPRLSLRPGPRSTPRPPSAAPTAFLGPRSPRPTPIPPLPPPSSPPPPRPQAGRERSDVGWTPGKEQDRGMKGAPPGVDGGMCWWPVEDCGSRCLGVGRRRRPRDPCTPLTPCLSPRYRRSSPVKDRRVASEEGGSGGGRPGETFQSS